MHEEKRTYTHGLLQAFCAELLEKAGARPEDAALVADSLVYAELRGIGSHGLLRLESYLARMEKGLVNADADMPLVRETPACALMDAENGFGQVAGVKAMDLAASKAEQIGVGLVSVKNSNHFGVSAYYAVRATRKNMAAIVLTNAGPAMTPFNGTRLLLGTNPFTAAVPVAESSPMVLDMATSEVAKGKIRKALDAGKSIPPGWAVDENGRSTTDPAAALKGSVCPMGGAKGSGLALMVDLFSGVLSGSSLTGDVRGVTDTSGPARVGHLFLAVNPAFFSGTDRFLADTAAVADRIHGQDAADGGRVFLPGEHEDMSERETRAAGILLGAGLVGRLNGHAARYGASPLR